MLLLTFPRWCRTPLKEAVFCECASVAAYLKNYMETNPGYEDDEFIETDDLNDDDDNDGDKGDVESGLENDNDELNGIYRGGGLMLRDGTRSNSRHRTISHSEQQRLR